MRFESNKLVEYLYKKSAYIFPAGTKIFLNGNKLLVEINNKKISNISMYLSKKVTINNGYNYMIGLPITGYGSQIAKDYQSIIDFFDKYQEIDFLQFENALNYELLLCTFIKSIDSNKTDNLVQDIYRELPYLINIFKRPLIHLKENDIIQPLDMVKRINHNTIRHLAIHTENWQSLNYNNNTIVPAKLLTKVYEDDYSIYENVIFRDLIDKILMFLRKNIFYLSEIIESFKESVKLDTVSKLNHQKYYLAIGKLYVGFYKMENFSEVLDMLENLKRLYIQLNDYKVAPIYTKNANVKPLNGELKKTNILTMHKDYKHVYYLYHEFQKKTILSQESGTFLMQAKSQLGYELFCQMLVIFAISNFNMLCKSSEKIYKDGKLSANFEYKDWSLTVSSSYNTILNLDTIVMNVLHKDISTKVLMIPMSYYIAQDKKMHYENIIEKLFHTGEVYDKYIFFEPFDFDDNSLNNYSIKYSMKGFNLFYAILPISISDINSFRRIQKIVFECLVLSDDSYDICAFCGEKLIKESDGKYLCKKCRTVIKNITCENCKKDFVATYIDIKIRNRVNKKTMEDSLKNVPEFYKQEKQYSYRNIVNMNKKDFVCPYCDRENKNIN